MSSILQKDVPARLNASLNTDRPLRVRMRHARDHPRGTLFAHMSYLDCIPEPGCEIQARSYVQLVPLFLLVVSTILMATLTHTVAIGTGTYVTY